MGQLLNLFTRSDNENLERQNTNNSYTFRQPPDYLNRQRSFDEDIFYNIRSSGGRRYTGSVRNWPNTGTHRSSTGFRQPHTAISATGRKITLYHYTTNENADQIYREKIVHGSTTWSTPLKYRQHGCGVYFTSLDPYEDPEHLVLNNFTNRGTTATRGLYRKIGSVVEISFYRYEVEKITGIDRDVYLYRGDIYLSNYEGRYRIYRNPNPLLPQTLHSHQTLNMYSYY